MKRIILLTTALLSISFMTYAQKSKVQTAWNYLKAEELDKAKTAIDEASVNEGSAMMPKCWYYRGMIYQEIYKNKKFTSLSEDPLPVAYQSYKKALELDPKYEYKDEIKVAMLGINQSIFNDGLKDFNEKEFTKALSKFETVLQMTPNDTSAIVNCALAADKAGEKQKAVTYYERVISMGYKDPAIYSSLIHAYKDLGQNDKAAATLKAARTAYPNDNNFMIEELNGVLTSGDDKKAAEMLDQAIKADPSNASLYFAAGTVYDKLANPRDPKGEELAKPTNYTELVNKSAAYYEDAIKHNDKYFDAYYNLGALYFNQGAELANQANLLPLNKQKEVDALNKQAAEKLKKAEPYLEKALELEPKDMSTLQSLKQLYVRTEQTEKYNEIKKKIEAAK